MRNVQTLSSSGRTRWIGGFFLLAAIGCGGQPQPSPPPVAATSQEELLKQLVNTQGQLVDVLSSIKDVASAQKAASQLEDLGGKIKTIAGSLQASGAISPELKAKFKQEFERRKSELQAKLGQFAANLITQPELLQSVQPLLNKLAELKDSFDGLLR